MSEQKVYDLDSLSAFIEIRLGPNGELPTIETLSLEELRLLRKIVDTAIDNRVDSYMKGAPS